MGSFGLWFWAKCSRLLPNTFLMRNTFSDLSSYYSSSEKVQVIVYFTWEKKSKSGKKLRILVFYIWYQNTILSFDTKAEFVYNDAFS